jgi:hypothetical protein
MRKKIMILSVAMLTLGSAFGAEVMDPTVGVTIAPLSVEAQTVIDALGGEEKARAELAASSEDNLLICNMLDLFVDYDVDKGAIIAEIRAHFSAK